MEAAITLSAGNYLGRIRINTKQIVVMTKNTKNINMILFRIYFAILINLYLSLLREILRSSFVTFLQFYQAPRRVPDKDKVNMILNEILFVA